MTHRIPGFTALTVLTGLTVLAPPASAADAGHVDVGVLTDVPIMVGLGATYESPWRVRAEVDLGVLPDPYLKLINTTMTGFNVYSDDVATLIETIMRGALVVRGELGFRPFVDKNYVFSAGYLFAGLAGGTTDLSLYDDGLSDAVRSDSDSFLTTLDATAKLHMLTVDAGHEWLLMEDRLVLRGSVGGAFTLSSTSEVTSDAATGNAIQEAARDKAVEEAEIYLDDTFQSYVHTPTVGFSAAWRF